MTERPLNVELEIHQAIIENSLDGILFVDHLTYRIKAVNTRFLDLFSIPPELRGSESDQPLLQFVISQIKDADQFLSLVQELYANPYRSSLDRLELVNGRVIDRHSEPAMIGDRILGRVWYFRDVTERLREQLRLQQSSKMASLGEMAGNIAHEINNPLAIIMGRATFLLNRIAQGDVPSVEKIVKDITSIHQVAERIEKIIKGLRSFARDGVRDPLFKTSLQQVVQESLDISAERFKNHGIQLAVAMPEQPIYVLARQVQIMQIVVNLLNNSYDALANQEDRRIFVQVTAKSGDQAEIRVQDNGPGVPAEVENKIMQPFFTTKEPNKGTGLGLSVALAISQEHGGTLELDLKESRSCFVLTLPRLTETAGKVA